MVDEVLFEKAKDIMTSGIRGGNGIGTLSEKSVHAVLKFYYAPNEQSHEIKIGEYVADACYDGEIYEIQTRNFYTMKKKLETYFQNGYDVTIVYPVSEINTIVWIDKESGELQRSRKVRVKNRYKEILSEIYGIREFLKEDKLHFIIAILETEDYRFLDGFGKDKKVRATKTDKYPVRMIDEIRIDDRSDLKIFLPDNLSEIFDKAAYSKEEGIHPTDAGIALRVLEEAGLVEKNGKEGRKFLYRKV